MTDFLLKILIVDDEIDAGEILRELLEGSGKKMEIEVLSDPRQAECTVQKYQPDLLFLDINMPNYDGISLLKNIREYNQQLDIVFVTAFESYIKEAIKLNVFSYMLKPVDRTELYEVIDGLYAKHGQKKQDNSDQKFRLPVRDGYIYLSLEEIFLLEADGNYTKIFTIYDDVYISSYNLGRISERIPGKKFLRINRKQFLNSFYLSQINKKKRLCTVRINGATLEYKLSGTFLKNFNRELQ